ncbi:S-adenosyl-L-methionine-dependent methyltransferase [Xylariaceae sp. FL1651]|nr:S-adenosyl-L-methionine-dependent methyltransferase [Xylariaceae sp. FL1651]
MGSNLDDTSRKLLQLGGLIQNAIAQFITLRHSASEKDEGSLPAKPLFDAQRTLLAAAGMITELVSEPQSRLLEVSSQYFEARALHIAASHRIPDILAQHGQEGLDIKSLAGKVGIESRKLSRVLRCLCSIHVFTEVDEDVFANNAISQALVGNEYLRSYILLFGFDLYSSSDHLPRYLGDRLKGHSYDVETTPWQDAVGTSKPRWEWLEEKTKIYHLRDGKNGTDGSASAYPGVFGPELEKALENESKSSCIPRPEHAIFGQAMVGGGRVFGQAQLYDFPWASLGSATLVDVGGGAGGFCLQLSHLYPDLKFVVQDRAPVLEQAESKVWPKENQAALEAGRVQFVPHNFFEPNPTKDADVYWLRYILHDWSDDYCVRILEAIRPAMGPHSRILICDQVMNTTRGCPELQAAPAPLPSNWGYYTRYSHQRDLAMMSIINGIERKPAELRDIAERAGLRLRKIWDCRSQVGLVELVLPDSPLA